MNKINRFKRTLLSIFPALLLYQRTSTPLVYLCNPEPITFFHISLVTSTKYHVVTGRVWFKCKTKHDKRLTLIVDNVVTKRKEKKKELNRRFHVLSARRDQHANVPVPRYKSLENYPTRQIDATPEPYHCFVGRSFDPCDTSFNRQTFCRSLKHVRFHRIKRNREAASRRETNENKKNNSVNIHYVRNSSCAKMKNEYSTAILFSVRF